MKKTMMYLPEDMHRYLSDEASRRGISMAEVAREAISEYRASRPTAEAKGISAIFGVIDTGEYDTAVAESIDEALAEYFGKGGRWDLENGFIDEDSACEG